MKNKYQQMMENIEVTPKMSKKILKNLAEAANIPPVPKRFLHIQSNRAFTVIACLALVVLAVTLLPPFLNDKQPPTIQVIPDIVSYASVQALSAAAGFAIAEPSELPFDYTETVYTLYFKRIAEIQYIGEQNTLVFRIAVGIEDISGDYNTYKDIKECQSDAGIITLKGQEGMYTSAIWSSNNMSFAISLNNPLNTDDLLNIVSSVK